MELGMSGTDATNVTPLGVFDSEDWVAHFAEYLTHDLTDRVLLYEHLVGVKNLGDVLRSIYELSLCQMTNAEGHFLDLMALNKLNYDQIKEILTYWVKVHNYLRSIWPPNTFRDDLFGFKCDITEAEKVNPSVNPDIPTASNVVAELTAVGTKMLAKGYIVGHLPLKVTHKSNPANAVNKGKFKRRHMVKKKPRCLA